MESYLKICNTAMMISAVRNFLASDLGHFVLTTALVICLHLLPATGTEYNESDKAIQMQLDDPVYEPTPFPPEEPAEILPALFHPPEPDLPVPLFAPPEPTAPLPELLVPEPTAPLPELLVPEPTAPLPESLVPEPTAPLPESPASEPATPVVETPAEPTPPIEMPAEPATPPPGPATPQPTLVAEQEKTNETPATPASAEASHPVTTAI
jgi:hypothetical protein